MSELRTVPFERLRKLRDIAEQLGAQELGDALQELIHLRSSRWAEYKWNCDERVTPEDLKP